jgi:hypothetical protein
MKPKCELIILSRIHVSQFLSTTSHLPPHHVHWTLDVSPSVGSIHMIKSQSATIQMTFAEIINPKQSQVMKVAKPTTMATKEIVVNIMHAKHG